MTPERPVFGPPPRHDLQLGRRYTRWAIWGCGVLGLAGVLILAGVMLVLTRNPGLWKASERMAACTQHLDEVSGALDRYRQDKGRLPANLDDLYPTYLANQRSLYCPADPEHGAHTSYLMRPGIPWGKGDQILVYCPHHPIRIRINGQTPEGGTNAVPVIRQDGATGRLQMTDAELKALAGR